MSARYSVKRNWHDDPLELPARTDIEVRGKKDTAGGTIAVTVGLDIVIIPISRPS